MAPILAGLFGLKFAAFLGFINPVGNFKLSLVNILLSPFGLTLANVGPPLNTNQPFAPFGGRDADSGFTLDQEKIDMVTDLLYNAMASYAVCSFVCQIGNSSTDLWETTDRTEICTLT